VRIVDDRPTGMGATQASAGVLGPYLEADEKTPAFLDLTVRSLGLFDQFVARVEADSGENVGYRRTGTIEIAATEGRLNALRSAGARLAARGVACDVLDAQAVRVEEPHLAPEVAGGLLIPGHGFLSASALTHALEAAARRHGAQVVQGARVRLIAREATNLALETTCGRLASEAVVLAAGSWSGQIDIEGSRNRVPVRPVRGQLLHVAWNGSPLRRVAWSERCYLVPWADGTLLIGATVEEAGFDERTTVAGVRDLLEAACELVPHAWTAGFLGARVGLRPGTPDNLPIIGASHAVPGLTYATGHYRNGVLLAPLTAQLVADAILDERIDPALAPLAPDRFDRL
jgi:glycine oxidase